MRFSNLKMWARLGKSDLSDRSPGIKMVNFTLTENVKISVKTVVQLVASTMQVYSWSISMCDLPSKFLCTLWNKEPYL